MLFFLEMILMGAFATWLMDFAAGFLVRRNIVRAPVEPHIPGRWALYMLKGRLAHADIRLAPALRYEKEAAVISHYLIGIALAGVYLALDLMIPALQGRIWPALLFGLASKAPNRMDCIVMSIINHFDYGLGLAVWMAAMHRFFV